MEENNNTPTGGSTGTPTEGASAPVKPTTPEAAPETPSTDAPAA